MKKAAILLSIAALVATANVAYAAKPTDSPSLKNTDKTVKETKQEKTRTQKEKPEKANVILKVYFYSQEVIDAAKDTGRADYTVWGKAIIKSKQQTILLNAHGLEKGAAYKLQYDGKDVATGTANEYGDLHLKVPFAEALNTNSYSKLTLAPAEGDSSGTTATLVGNTSHIKHLTDMEGTEETADEE